ncbi:MAG: hypothetical protein MUO91_09310, partial [candidate division Zixibacteria bacterium]|nr:hypothetical protein [candidate division Zixibacteria bacterium]
MGYNKYVSLKRIHISFVILVFVFFPAFGGSTSFDFAQDRSLTTLSLSKGGIFNILVVPVFGYGFSKDHGLILNYSTSDSSLDLKRVSFQSPLFSLDFSDYEDGWKKWGKIPILKYQDSPKLNQSSSSVPRLRRDLRQGDYSKKKSLSSPPAVFDPEAQTRRAGSSTYSIMKSRISYRKASVIGGLNLVAVTLGFHQAVNAWGESKGKFHVKDDWKGDGLAQTDELSHFMWGYKMTQFLYCVYDWAGFSPKTSQALSSSESALISTLVEYPIDAYNPKQGL